MMNLELKPFFLLNLCKEKHHPKRYKIVFLSSNRIVTHTASQMIFLNFTYEKSDGYKGGQPWTRMFHGFLIF